MKYSTQQGCDYQQSTNKSPAIFCWNFFVFHGQDVLCTYQQRFACSSSQGFEYNFNLHYRPTDILSSIINLLEFPNSFEHFWNIPVSSSQRFEYSFNLHYRPTDILSSFNGIINLLEFPNSSEHFWNIPGTF